MFTTLAPIGLGPSLRIDRNGAWRATRTPDGLSTIHLTHSGDRIEVEAWGPGAQWASARAPVLCGEEDDPSGFHPQHPLISDLHRRHPGLRLTKTGAVFETLVPVVLAQKVTTIEAHKGYRALVDALGEPAPGPVRMTIPPSAQVLARTPYWTFHGFGVERRRADVIIRAATSAYRLRENTTIDREGASPPPEALVRVW